jgi:hypothetical protein
MLIRTKAKRGRKAAGYSFTVANSRMSADEAPTPIVQSPFGIA